MREAQTEFEKLLTAAMGQVADKLEDIMVSKEMQAFLKHGGTDDKGKTFPPHFVIVDVLEQIMDNSFDYFTKVTKTEKPDGFSASYILARYLEAPKHLKLSNMVKLVRKDQLQ